MFKSRHEYEQQLETTYISEPVFEKPEPGFIISLSTPSSKYRHDFEPIDKVKLTKGQDQKAQECKVTHVCVFDGNEPLWLKTAAEKAGYKAVCLGYTRHRRHGFVTKEVWGLAATEA
jgi:hypothetical protein